MITKTRKKIWFVPGLFFGLIGFKAVVTEWRWRGIRIWRKFLYRENGKCYVSWNDWDVWDYQRGEFLER